MALLKGTEELYSRQGMPDDNNVSLFFSARFFVFTDLLLWAMGLILSADRVKQRSVDLFF